MGADTASPIYSIARARKARAVVVAWRGRGPPIAAHDAFISSKARNAQYSTALPYVKSRQIAKSRLVLPNCTLVANRRSRKVWPIPIWQVE